MNRAVPLFLVALASLSSACAPARMVAVTAAEVTDGPTSLSTPFGRVSCGHGQVCAEVAVERADIYERAGLDRGDVELTLRNRTGDAVTVQVAIESFGKGGARADRSVFLTVPLPAHQQHVVRFEDVRAVKGDLVVHLRDRF